MVHRLYEFSCLLSRHSIRKFNCIPYRRCGLLRGFETTWYMIACRGVSQSFSFFKLFHEQPGINYDLANLSAMLYKSTYPYSSSSRRSYRTLRLTESQVLTALTTRKLGRKVPFCSRSVPNTSTGRSTCCPHCLTNSRKRYITQSISVDTDLKAFFRESVQPM